jgi:hypothetical protein
MEGMNSLLYRHLTVELHGDLMKNFRGSIGRAIIQNNDFNVGIILREQTFHTSANVSLFIARGHTERDQRRVPRRRYGLNHNIKLILVMEPINNNNAAEEEGSGKKEINHKIAASPTGRCRRIMSRNDMS